MFQRVPLHPLLAAACAVMVLWALNRDEVVPAAGLPVLVAVVAAAAALTVLAALLWRDTRRGALTATVVAAIALVHGHLWGTEGSLRAALGLPVAVVVTAAVVIWLRRIEDDALGRITAWTNLAALLAVLVPLSAVVATWDAAASLPEGRPNVLGGQSVAEVVSEGPRRDVVWIVPDRHGGVESLRRSFDLDTAPFTEALRERGFAVANEARANYPRTSQSLAAMLNLSYLDEVAAQVPATERESWATYYALLQDHEMGRLFTGGGYEYWHLGSWWQGTATAVDAERVLTLDADRGPLASEFGQAFLDGTVVPAVQAGVARVLAGPGPGAKERPVPPLRQTHLDHNLHALEQMDKIPGELAQDTERAPRFVFLHLLLPHVPYVFDRDGSIVDAATESERSRADNFGRQLDFTHQRLLRFVDELLAVPEDQAPIVLVAADEGPHPDDLNSNAYAWSAASDDELVAKFSVLSALRVPGVDPEGLLPDDVTGVNLARILVNEALGTNLEPLPDRSFIYPEPTDRYAFVDVTERLDAATN